MPDGRNQVFGERQGKKLVHTNVRNNDFEFFLKLVDPYRRDLTVCCECMFGWYWLADACEEAGLRFVLAHALYVRAIHGGKNKNDRVDSEKLTHLLRSNLIPPAYVYPAEKRPLRALLRQRLFYVWQRAELLARINSHQLAHSLWVDCRKFLDRPAAFDRGAGRPGEVRLAPGSAPPD